MSILRQRIVSIHKREIELQLAHVEETRTRTRNQFLEKERHDEHIAIGTETDEHLPCDHLGALFGLHKQIGYSKDRKGTEKDVEDDPERSTGELKLRNERKRVVV